MATSTASNKKQDAQTDFLPLQGTDYVEFYCWQCKTSGSLLYECFWFPGIGLWGPETGIKTGPVMPFGKIN
jgi:4-hydroxyphenylpyruvate dioxygenase